MSCIRESRSCQQKKIILTSVVSIYRQPPPSPLPRRAFACTCTAACLPVFPWRVHFACAGEAAFLRYTSQLCIFSNRWGIPRNCHSFLISCKGWCNFLCKANLRAERCSLNRNNVGLLAFTKPAQRDAHPYLKSRQRPGGGGGGGGLHLVLLHGGVRTCCSCYFHDGIDRCPLFGPRPLIWHFTRVYLHGFRFVSSGHPTPACRRHCPFRVFLGQHGVQNRRLPSTVPIFMKVDCRGSHLQQGRVWTYCQIETRPARMGNCCMGHCECCDCCPGCKCCPCCVCSPCCRQQTESPYKPQDASVPYQELGPDPAENTSAVTGRVEEER